MKSKNKKPLLNLRESLGVKKKFFFFPLSLFPPFSIGYDEQEIILSRQQHRPTAWNTSILLSQKKKKIARGSNFSQYLVTLENNVII